jgi:hypothetical protein
VHKSKSGGFGTRGDPKFLRPGGPFVPQSFAPAETLDINPTDSPTILFGDTEIPLFHSV